MILFMGGDAWSGGAWSQEESGPGGACARPPPGRLLLRTVRILLECILVKNSSLVSDWVLPIGTARIAGAELPVRREQPRGGGAVPPAQWGHHPGAGGTPSRTAGRALRPGANQPRHTVETILLVSSVNYKGSFTPREGGSENKNFNWCLPFILWVFACSLNFFGSLPAFSSCE